MLRRIVFVLAVTGVSGGVFLSGDDGAPSGIVIRSGDGVLTAEALNLDVDRAESQRHYLELQQQLSDRLTTDELQKRIAAAEQELAQTRANERLREIWADLEKLQADFPHTTAAASAYRAIELFKEDEAKVQANKAQDAARAGNRYQGL